MVTVAKGGGERLQNNSTHALTTGVAIGTSIPHARTARGRQHVQIALSDVHGCLWVSKAAEAGRWRDRRGLTGPKDQVGAGSNGDRALATPQDLDGLMHGNERGRAGSVDGHGRAVPVEEVRDAVGDDAAGRAGGSIGGDVLSIAVDNLGKVVAHDTDIGGSVGSRKGLDARARGLEGLVDGLHQQTLLRIDGLGLGGGDAEELGIEDTGVLGKKVRVEDVAGTVVMPILVVPVVGAEAVDLAEDIAGVGKQVPQLGGPARVPGEAASTADDGDGLVLVGRHREHVSGRIRSELLIDWRLTDVESGLAVQIQGLSTAY